MSDTPKPDLQALLDAATDGPWGVNKYGSVGAGAHSIAVIIAEVQPLYGIDAVHGGGNANARLIAMAPDLAKRVLELEAALRQAEPHIELLHSLLPKGNARKMVFDVVKDCRQALKGGAS